MATRRRFSKLKSALKLMGKKDGTVAPPPEGTFLDSFKDNLSRTKKYGGLRGISRVKKTVGIYPFYKPVIESKAATDTTEGNPGTLIEIKYTSELIIKKVDGLEPRTVDTTDSPFKLDSTITAKANHYINVPADRMAYGYSPAKAVVFIGTRLTTSSEVESLISNRKYNVSVKGHSLTLPYGQDADAAVKNASMIFLEIQKAAKNKHTNSTDVVQVTNIPERFPS
jgi:hypothetical protein